MNTINMTEEAPWKHILKFSIPVFLGALIQQFYNTVDAIVVGRYLGEKALSAVGTTGSFAFLFLAFAIGLSSGNGVAVAQNYGANKLLEVRRNAANGILFLVFLGIIFTIIGFGISKVAFLYFVNVPVGILDVTMSYFNIYLIGLIFQYGYNIFSAILRAVGDSTATLYFLLISSVLNIILDIIFVANFNWGVVGATGATVISQALSFFAAYFYMTIRYPIFRFRIDDYKLDLSLIKNTVLIGLPISLQLIVVSFGLTFIQRAVNDFGETMIASFTVGQRIETYLSLPCNAFQTTLATYTGQNIGAKKLDRIKIGVKQTTLMSLLFTIIISITIWTFADKIIELFNLGKESSQYCLNHLRAVSIINIVLSTYIPLFGVFQGTGHSILPMVVAVGALGMRVFVTYLFRYSEYFGSSIIWWNGIFGFGIGFLITWYFYLSGKWKNNY